MSNQNQSDQKIDRLALNQMSMFMSAFAVLICAGIHLFYSPVIFVEAFFLFQVGVRYVTYFHVRTESRFIEVLLTSPAKLLTAWLMVGYGIPKDNVWGIVWIALALLFTFSGFKGLRNVMKVAQENHADTAKFEHMVTASQRQKETKVEDALMADLEAFLNKPDSENK